MLDDLSADHEARLAPKPPWTRAKMTPGRFEAMLKAIVGFEMTVEALRGTNKLGQHKQAADRAAAADGLAPFNPELAALMRRRERPRMTPEQETRMWRNRFIADESGADRRHRRGCCSRSCSGRATRSSRAAPSSASRSP